MPTPQPFDSPSASSNNANSYFSYPVRSTLGAAFRRLPSNFRSSRSSSKPTSRDPSQTREANISSTAHDRIAGQSNGARGAGGLYNGRTPQPKRKKEPINLIDLQSDDELPPNNFEDEEDDDFGDYADGSEANSIQLPPPPPFASARANSYTPSPRATPPPPPFQPPPLTPLTLDGLSNSAADQLLTPLVAEEVRLLLPPRLQLCDTWSILFSLSRDGSALSTLYNACEEQRGRRGGFTLVVKDSTGGIFGAYLSDPPAPSKGHYYGNGECFLWRCSVLGAGGGDRGMDLLSGGMNGFDMSGLPPPPSADTTNATRSTTLGSPKNSLSDNMLRPPDLRNGGGAHGGTGTSTPERIRFKAFPYSGMNDYMIFCEQGFLSVGGGDGHYGLWLDNALENGVSESCPTFGNEPLSDEGKKFEVLGVEVWYVG